ncbi:MAG: hypothetical protein IPN77_15445 [Sandaracinaceae bacterium]|nr:hypothetical protein [Sandaracinaceae bacterium]
MGKHAERALVLVDGGEAHPLELRREALLAQAAGAQARPVAPRRGLRHAAVELLVRIGRVAGRLELLRDETPQRRRAGDASRLTRAAQGARVVTAAAKLRGLGGELSTLLGGLAAEGRGTLGGGVARVGQQHDDRQRSQRDETARCGSWV